MDDVPVKIVERYKPPPIVYQLPQSIANKLSQETNFYNENPQFQYDFQLERNVLTQVQCWKQMRQLEREARQQRIERRKHEKQRAIEAQQKEMLGAVQYPSAEELSSSSSLDESDADGGGVCGINNVNNDENNDGEENNYSESCVANKATKISEIAVTKTTTATTIRAVTKTPNAAVADQTQKSINSSNFHNILQPTILNRKSPDNSSNQTENTIDDVNAMPNLANVSFNYADFEYDNSSPFDNIELKTINDLDILAQVLHNTQLKKSPIEDVAVGADSATSEVVTVTTPNNFESMIPEAVATDGTSIHLADLAASKAALEKVDFSSSYNQCDEVVSIPIGNATDVVTHSAEQPEQQTFSKNYTHQPYQLYLSPSQHYQHQSIQHHTNHQTTSIQAYHMQQSHTPPPPDAVFMSHQYGYHIPTTTTTASAYNNQNYLLTNGHHLQQHNIYGTPTHQKTATTTSNTTAYLTTANAVTTATDAELKSKSVPDILRELKTELINSEMRRARNLSHTLDDNKEPQDQNELATKATTLPKSVFNELTAPARMLAKRISTMGFPLERVANVVHICGADDKKIIEHLIPLSELMDLGFDESKISAALLKFNNNKDKALDYLIS